MRIQNPPVGKKPHKSVGRCDGVQVGLSSVENVSVRLPDLPQHLDAQGQRLLPGKREAFVHPRLTEVAVHRITLKLNFFKNSVNVKISFFK